MSSRSRASYGVAIASVSVLVLAGVGLPAGLADQPAGGRGGDERPRPVTALDADRARATARFALVKAVDTTSAPILKRLGFAPYGDQRCWSLPLR